MENQIRWRTKVTYIDIDTAEILTEQEAKKAYIIINKKTQKNVYKTTGTINITNECRRSRQIKINNEW